MTAYVVGGFVMSGLAVRITERFGVPSSVLAGWLLEWALVRTWLWAVLPVFGWGVGRYFEVTPWRFALSSVLFAEAFGLLLATAGDGIEWVLRSPADIAMRVLTLGAGLVLVKWSVQKGLDAADAAQAEANVEAEKRKAEYAEFLARVEGKEE